MKEGKEVKSDVGCRYKMIDGVICFWFGESWLVGADIDDDGNPYIEEAEPLEIEVGKFYKTKRGEKVWCQFYDIDSGYCMNTQGVDYNYTVNQQGTALNDCDEDNIVSLWED